MAVGLLIFGLFSSSFGLIVFFKKNKWLGFAYLGAFIICLVLAFNGTSILPIIILGIVSLLYSIYAFIKWIFTKLLKKKKKK